MVGENHGIMERACVDDEEKLMFELFLNSLPLCSCGIGSQLKGWY